MQSSKEKIKEYYDKNLGGKLDGFINGNPRVEKAWQTIVQYGGSPKNILEIGCGIGDICFRMATLWEQATITGVDISEKSIQTAQKLFGSEKIKFISGILDPEIFNEQFDLVILMDVYEHISLNDRYDFNVAIKKLIFKNASIIMSFPTPEYLEWLKLNNPDQIQPVDEYITLDVLCSMAEETETKLLFYKHVNVWGVSDYAHAILGSTLPEPSLKFPGMKDVIKNKLKNTITRQNTKNLVEQRKEFVKEKLGIQYPF